MFKSCSPLTKDVHNRRLADFPNFAMLASSLTTSQSRFLLLATLKNQEMDRISSVVFVNSDRQTEDLAVMSLLSKTSPSFGIFLCP